ncbi:MULTISPECIES: selenium-dependent molybdenum cofactor biosynthesis protein YqeB [unclassified Pseudodesulfovibrio]|uniref:selenium-dependent molybdenum cofactor biosynthesis protein YqeB n=1 Tax=unclassified Pseudodesulfovibrio TaxID=2661612 RepID=UPI000FEBCA34|nr:MULTISPECIES: selenium-dependent molybdenum cofactor biosynthesis protein YqeB [unclassified Pseudodesulfovibrio]MCJ2164730.1 selenium-dependent molybdenum cofactor biosynthesis protein YqeB [Pseudodesulfovibrio sp. S3-i]RWU04081.1 EF2563 family selenium-dependent molybdenum hydroxylase system protein [Pseudodesulfovibrio sp. S3]
MYTMNIPTIAIRGAGDLATGVALRLYQAGLSRVLLLETPSPLAVRRTVAFSEAVYHAEMTVEGVKAVLVSSPDHLEKTWAAGDIPVLVDPQANSLPLVQPDVLVDAILAKRNLGTSKAQAPLVIGLGPGFTAGQDVHRVIETKRGHHLGRVITYGPAAPNTGIPGTIAGFSIERVHWAEHDGIFTSSFDIGHVVEKGDVFGFVNDTPVVAALSGVIRGLLRTNTPVMKRTKLADVDPRGTISYCNEVSDKALAIGGGVLEAICEHLFLRCA